MDLGAYVQIEDFDKLMEEQGISVPRLRGVRLMSEQERITEAEINECVSASRRNILEDALCSIPPFHPYSNRFEFSQRTDRLEEKYLIKNDEGNVIGFRWNLLNRKIRKRIKLALKRKEREVRKNLETFNKYAGVEGVLCIHARIGGDNWCRYDGPKEVASKPWFIEKVDDYFDDTYCDIYARIDAPNVEVEHETD